MGYQHLAEHERYQIFILKQAGLPVIEIARQLNRHRCTIYRELVRNQNNRGQTTIVFAAS